MEHSSGAASGRPARQVRPGRRTAEDIDEFDVADAKGIAHTGPAQEAWVQMREITHPPGLMDASGKLARDLGVTHGAIRALRPLSNNGPTTMSGLAAQLRCDGSYVTNLIDTLERAGLAERRSDTNDRRVKVVVLTKKGREIARRACAAVITPPPSFSALSADELDQLLRLLRKIRSAEQGA